MQHSGQVVTILAMVIAFFGGAMNSVDVLFASMLVGILGVWLEIKYDVEATTWWRQAFKRLRRKSL